MTQDITEEEQKKSSFGQENDDQEQSEPTEIKDLFIKAVIGAVAVTLACAILMLAWPQIQQMKKALDEKHQEDSRYRNCSFDEEQQNARDVFCP